MKFANIIISSFLIMNIVLSIKLANTVKAQTDSTVKILKEI